MQRNYQALLVERCGGGVRASIKSLSAPAAKSGEVLIEVHYSSLNYKDALAINGPSGVMRRLPLVAGVDAAGVVIESNCGSFKQGDQVIITGYELSQSHDGGYAELLCVPAEWLVPLPEGLTLRQSMALGTAGFTAALAIHRLLQNEQSPLQGPIVITGASGGVASFAINILSGMGFDVSALTAKPERCESYLRGLGASEIIDRRSLAIGDRPLEQGLWGGAIDNLGGETLEWLTRTVKPYGNIAACGLAASSAFHTTVMPFILRGVSVLGVASSLCDMPLRKQLWKNLAREWRPVNLSDIADKEIKLDELFDVSKKMLSGEIFGRYIVAIRN